MSAIALLRTLFSYRAWANAEFLDKMEGFDAGLHAQDRQAALRLLNHNYIVDQIFAAHLTGVPHHFATDNTPDTPTLEALRHALAASDRWYLDYLDSATPELLSESVPFVFTDGDQGCMSREEILTHLVIHSGYHRGEIGRVMSRLAINMPWDTFAVYLHQTDPSRRLKMRGEARSSPAELHWKAA
jgi:uncharacterized damage-inducible protein DinB